MSQTAAGAKDPVLADDPSPTPPKGTTPTRGRRYRLFAEGDYFVMRIADGSHKEIPKGSYLAIPGVPNFPDSAEAKRWIRADSGDKLAGMQVVVIKVMEVMAVRAINKPTVEVSAKPKTLIGGDGGEEKA